MKKAIAIMLSVLVLFAVVPAGALQASALENGDVQLTLNVPYAAEIGGNETKSFFFTPESDGIYIFSSQSELDTRASLNSDQDYLAYDDDDGEDFNFLIEYFLTAGVTYRLDVDLLGGGNGGSVAILCALSDKVPATGFRFAVGETATGYTGTDLTLALVAEPENGLVSGVSYMSSDTDVADIRYVYSDEVVLSCCGTGETVITATDDQNHTAQCTVTVREPAAVEMGKEYTGSFNAKGESVYYRFVPQETKEYFIAATASEMLRVKILDDYGGSLDNIMYYNGKVRISEELEENEVYYIGVIADSASTGDYTLTISDGFSLSGIAVETMPDNTHYMEGFSYDDVDLEGLELKLTWSDGVETVWKNDASYDEREEALRGEQLNFSLDEENRICAVCGDCTAYIPLTVTASTVESIELVDAPHWTYYEEFEGYWNTRWNPATDSYDGQYYYYSPKGTYSIQVLIRYKDGTSETAHIYEQIGGSTIQISDDQAETPWTVGEHAFTVSYLDKQAIIPVTVLPNPVASVSIEEGAALTLIENADGYWSEAVTPEGVKPAFYYYLPDMSAYEVTIRFTDGRTATAKADKMFEGYRVETGGDQYSKPWTPGGDNYLTVSYMGRETRMPVIIGETPVDHIEITSAPSRVYLYGDEYFGGTEHFMPDDLTGLAFDVHFKDGTVKSYTGSQIDYEYIDGHKFTLTPSLPQQVGENEVRFSYLGAEATYNVTVREDNIKSIAMTKLPPVAVFDQYFLPDWIGAEITVTYTDGSTSSVTLDEDNVSYRVTFTNQVVTTFELDGVFGRISGEKAYSIRYGSTTAEIEGMRYVEHAKLTALEVEDFTMTGKNMLVKMHFEDGTDEQYRFEDTPPVNYPMASIRAGVARTEKGMLVYMISLYFMEEQGVNIGGVFAPVEHFRVGDVDGDLLLTVNDATVLQRYLSEYDIENADKVRVCSDMNFNGVIDVGDVTAIQRTLAEIG